MLKNTSGQIDETRDANASGNPKAGTSRDLPETTDVVGGVSDEMIDFWIERSELFEPPRNDYFGPMPEELEESQ